MRILTYFFLLALIAQTSFAQQQTLSNNIGQLSPTMGVDNTMFIYVGSKDNFIHLVWEKHKTFDVKYYMIEQSLDGTNYQTLDSVQSGDLFDIHANNYPPNTNYDNNILYSTETGSGRFIYNDILNRIELAQRNIWYRIKMRMGDGSILYSREVVESFGFKSIEYNEVQPGSEIVSPNMPAQLATNVELVGQSAPASNARRAGCPAVQIPPSGFVFDQVINKFFGDCCYWEESLYLLQVVSNACGGRQAMCCPVDCSPLSFDPCCVHICSEYSRCSCPPWPCCDVSAAQRVWVVTKSVNYSISATVTGTTDVTCFDGVDGTVAITVVGGDPNSVIGFTWNNGTSTGSGNTNLGAGNYSMTVSDVGCFDIVTFTINQPDTFASVTNEFSPTCFGDNDGAIDLTVSGGNPPYTYSWNGGIYTTEDLTGIGPGTYIVVVTDDKGCVHTNSLQFNEPVEFEGTINTVDVECFNIATGTAVLTVSGGIAPPTYNWSPGGATTPNVSDLTAGVYRVTATDANGCSFTETAVINGPTEIIASFQTTNTSCGVCNGTATVNATGGNGIYLYQWGASAGNQTSQTVTGLCAGLHTVEVFDSLAVGCSKLFSVTIGNLGAENLSVSGIDATTFGVCDGSATVTIIGGCSIPQCTIEWFDASTGMSINQTTATATGLCAGDYTVQVINGASCETFANVTIAEPTQFTVVLNVADETCIDVCDGTITTVINGGFPPFQYQWLNDAGVPITGETGSSLLNACAGDYSVLITDAANTSQTFDATVNTSILTATTSATELACYGDCNATITVVPDGGTRPYSYQWLDGSASPIQGATSANFFNACVGSYSVEVTDANGCFIVTPVITITEPSLLSATSTKNDVLCQGDCDGSASVTALGGTLPYSYQWFNEFNLPIQGETSNTINNICAGIYFVRVVDANGCATNQISVSILENTLIVLSLTSENVSCNGAQDGTVNLSVSGGVEPYTYDWNNGTSMTKDLTGLSGDMYSVVVTDSNGCSATGQINVVEPLPFTLDAVANTFGDNGNHFSCNGANDGSATAFTTGGTVPFFYNWSDPMNQTTGTATELMLGTYHVTVTDANGCSATDSVILDKQPDPITSDITAFVQPNGYNVSCFNASDGSIDLTTGGGSPPFRISWNTGDFFGEDLTNVPRGEYIVIILDTINNCIVRDTTFLTSPPEIVPVLTPSMYVNGFNISFPGGSDGSIDLEVSGGFSPYTYSWDNGETTQDIDSLEAGTYTCEITDSMGCMVLARIDLIGPPRNQIVFTVDASICQGDSMFLEDAWQTMSGTYYDTVGRSISDDTIRETILSVLPHSSAIINVTICEGESYFAGGAEQTQSGTYVDVIAAANGCDSTLTTNLDVLPVSGSSVQVEICFGESYFAGGADQTESGIYIDTLASANGCDSILTTDLSVSDEIFLSFSHTSSNCSATCDGAASVSAFGGVPPYTYLWNNGSQSENLDSLCAGAYDVTVTDAEGCTETGGIVIENGQLEIDVTVDDLDCNCTNYVASEAICVINFSDLPAGTIINEQYANQGVHITGEAYGNGINELILFNSNGSGSQDPDLEVSLGNLAIFPTTLVDGNGDGLVDAPNDTYTGGKQIYTFDSPRTVVSLVFVDKENTNGNVKVFDDQNNMIKMVALLGMGNGSVQTVMINASGVSKMVIDYFYESGGVTEIVLGCEMECCDGAASVTVSSGTPPYSYIWSNGNTTSGIGSLCAGVYGVTISDAFGCADSISVTIENYVPIVLDVTHTDATLDCVGADFYTSPACVLNFSDLPTGTILNEQYANDGIHISGEAYDGRISELIVFNSNAGGTPDPDLEVNLGNLAIFPENLTDANNDGLVDVPNDQFAGGKQIYMFDNERTVMSLVFVDMDDNSGSASVYDAQGDLIKNMSIPAAGDGSVQTVMINESGVRKLVVDYRFNSGGVTEIKFGCEAECCDGTAAVTVTGGTPPYSYAWNNGNNAASIDSLCAGSYEVTITDADSCDEVATVEITAPVRNASKSIATGISDLNNSGLEVNVFPLPFDNSFVVDVYSQSNEEGYIKVFDVIGQEVYSQQIELQVGGNKYDINAKNWLASGIYVLELRLGAKTEIVKLYKSY